MAYTLDKKVERENMAYTLDKKVERENLLCKTLPLPEQRSIVTVGDCLIGYNHPKPKEGKEDIGPNCLFIQKGHRIRIPSFKPILNRRDPDYGIIIWAIELMNNRSGYEKGGKIREEMYLFIESIIPNKRIPIWDWELGRTNPKYLDHMNENLEKFEWKNSVFHENLRVVNSMTKFTENAKHNIDLFSFTISGIAESADLSKSHKKSGYVSMAGYFKREITRDILLKIVQGIYYDFYVEDNQYDHNGNIIPGREYYNYKKYTVTDLIKYNSKTDGESFENYRMRIYIEYAKKLCDWYFPRKGEDSQFSISRIREGIDFSMKLRSKNRTSTELFKTDF